MLLIFFLYLVYDCCRVFVELLDNSSVVREAALAADLITAWNPFVEVALAVDQRRAGGQDIGRQRSQFGRKLR